MERLKILLKKWSEISLGNRLWWIGIFLFMLGVEGRNFIQGYSAQSVRVIAAKRDLVPGSIVSIEDLTVTHVPKDKKQDYFSEQVVHEVTGAEVLQFCRANEAIFTSQIRQPPPRSLSVRVPKGLRAYSINLEQVMPIVAGDYVDVLGGAAEGSSEILLENREVLLIKKREENQQIFLAVNLEEARRLDSMKEKTNLSVVLRNPSDQSHKKSLPRKKLKVRKQTIQILQDG